MERLWRLPTIFRKYFPTCVRQNTVALVASDTIYALPLVQARVGGALIDIGLAVWACGQSKTRASVPADGHKEDPVCQGEKHQHRILHTTQILTGEARTARANVAAGHVLAGATIHTWVGFTFVVVDVAVFATPARVTQALVAEIGEMIGKK